MQPSIKKNQNPPSPTLPSLKRIRKKRVKIENATRPRETYLSKGK